MDTSYPPPVDQLLTLGDPDSGEWLDYREMVLGEEHVPDLIRMATDEALIFGEFEDDDDPALWAPIHAWRALGQLRAEAAIEPLTTRFVETLENDWVAEELPEVFAMIGPAAIPALTRYLQDRSRTRWPRITAASSLERIATHHPETRDAVITTLVERLDPQVEEDPDFLGSIISDLLDLKAVEAAPAIERAFVDDRVDESIAGDWEDVQVALGLLEERVTPRPRYDHFASMRRLPDPELPPPERPVQSPQAAKKKGQTKAKKKMAKQSRKQNRKRK